MTAVRDSRPRWASSLQAVTLLGASFIMVVLCVAPLTAQSAIRGVVLDAETLAPVGATSVVLSGTGLRGLTNEEGRFEIAAMDRTTEELRTIIASRASRLEPLTPEALLTFFERCDLIKFARLAPPPEEARGDLETVRQMVHDTESARRAARASSSRSNTMARSTPMVSVRASRIRSAISCSETIETIASEISRTATR